MPAVTENTLRVAFVIPAELSSNGPIKRVRIINRVFGSTNDVLATYFESNSASSLAIPPYFALEVNLQQSRKRGLVKRQANVRVYKSIEQTRLAMTISSSVQ